MMTRITAAIFPWHFEHIPDGGSSFSLGCSALHRRQVLTAFVDGLWWVVISINFGRMDIKLLNNFYLQEKYKKTWRL